MNASDPVTSANARIAAAGPSTAPAPAPPVRFSMPAQEPGLRRREAERRQQPARLRDGEERAAEHPQHQRDHRLPRLRLVGRPRERRHERHHRGRGEHARRRSGSRRRAGCPSAPTSRKWVASASTTMLDDAQHETRQQLADQHGAAADRRDEHPRERPVAALVEDARDPELDGEEQEEDRHAGGVERARVELPALGRDVGERDRHGERRAGTGLAEPGALPARPPRSAACRRGSANDCAIDCATCAPIVESTLPSTRSDAGRPCPTAVEKPGGQHKRRRDLVGVRRARDRRRATARARRVIRPLRSSGRSA